MYYGGTEYHVTTLSSEPESESVFGVNPIWWYGLMDHLDHQVTMDREPIQGIGFNTVWHQ